MNPPLSKLYSHLFEVLTLLVSLGIVFYLLRKFIILPIVELSHAFGLIAHDREEDINIPTTRILEIANLSHQIEVIKKYKTSLIEAKKSQERFFANMSHELRTPLNGILNFSFMMQKKMFGEINEEYVEMSTDIHTSGMHLLNLVNDILDFSKMDLQKVQLNESEFNLILEIKEAVKITSSDNAAMDYGATRVLYEIVPNITNGNLQFYGDRRMIKQILLNLLSNAVKFTDRGKVTLKLFMNDENDLAIEVQDSGIGIRKEDLTKLAQEFTQVGDAYSRREKQGSGLGLFLTKKMIELHQGKFEIDSVYGEGTTVSVTLPQNRLRT